MAKRPEDYTSRTFLFAMATLVVLMAISVIPPIEAGGVSLRRANIMSDLIRFDNDAAPAAGEEPAQPEIDVEEFHVDLDEVERQVAEAAREASPTGQGTSVSWQGIFDQQAADTTATQSDPTAADSLAARSQAIAEADFSALLPDEATIIPVEEFHEGEGPTPLQRLYDKLLDGTQPVRVAFMGDSFVEGDILTADLREMLQETFGGGGVGFVPAASPFTGFRQTVKTTSKGWTPYNIMQRKSVPDPYAGDFFVSGWVAAASGNGASTRWDMTTRRRHLDECRRARLLFISRKPSQVSVSLNDGEVRTFGFEGDEVVRQIVIEEPQIRSLEMRIEKGAEGVTVYGADFDDLKGVAVDNLSIRSNNGQAMFWTSPTVNAQINSMRAYDLVILQYGLNIMQADRRDYSLYAEQIGKMIRFVRSCFPEAAVIVMGVSDRSQRNENGITPMESARDLSQWQRTAAEECGAAFWNTYEAMQLAGGMTRFVDNGWAGKDYTHINYAGGAQVARALYYGLLQGVQRHLEYLQQAIERQQPVIAEPLPDIAPAADNTLEAEPVRLTAPLTDDDLRPDPRPLPQPNMQPRP